MVCQACVPQNLLVCAKETNIDWQEKVTGNSMKHALSAIEKVNIYKISLPYNRKAIL